MLNPILPHITALTERLKNEYEAHFFYRNAANWCANKGYDKAAAFFAAEAASELTHADKIQKFITDWGNDVSIPAISVSEDFESLPDIIGKAYDIESALYQAYDKCASDLYVDRSYFNLMLEFVGIQRDSVAEYRTMVDKLDLVGEDKTSIFIYENEVF